MSGGITRKCSIELRDLPLERFRLPKDTRKWEAAARSRRMVLEFIASFANGDGSFRGMTGNFSPSMERQCNHSGFSRGWVRQLHEDLRELGFLTWNIVRTKNGQRRKLYEISIRAPEAASEAETPAGETMDALQSPPWLEAMDTLESPCHGHYSEVHGESRVTMPCALQSDHIRLLQSEDSVSLPSTENRATTDSLSAQEIPFSEHNSVSGRGEDVGALGEAFAKITHKMLRASKDYRQFLQRQIERLGFEGAKAVVEAFATDERHDWDKLRCPAAVLQRDWTSYQALAEHRQTELKEQQDLRAEIERALKAGQAQIDAEHAETMRKLAEERAELERLKTLAPGDFGSW
jgi:hypothetical protein